MSNPSDKSARRTLRQMIRLRGDLDQRAAQVEEQAALSVSRLADRSDEILALIKRVREAVNAGVSVRITEPQLLLDVLLAGYSHLDARTHASMVDTVNGIVRSIRDGKGGA